VSTRKAFTIIELLVVMVLISILAAVSVPHIEEWVARQQARQFTAGLIADFSKAALISRTNQNLGDPAHSILPLSSGSTFSKAALYFNFQNLVQYSILMRTAPNASLIGWSPATAETLKSVPIPRRITIYSVNNISSGVVAFVFTPSGEVRSIYNYVITPSQQNCGTQTSTKLYTAQIEFRANVRSSDALFYRLEMNSFGEYRLCQSIGNNTFTETGDVEVKGL
jgi:prepilin-type N-terminal cleavage/methylation domain-containing protein